MSTPIVKRTKRQQAAHEKKIEQVAMNLRKFLEERKLWEGCRMYFNGKCMVRKSDTEDDIDDGHDSRVYTEYANADTICLIFEESQLYEELNYGTYNPLTGKYNWKTTDELHEFFESTPYYYELGHAWNLSLCER